jgi:hypothetical protein
LWQAILLARTTRALESAHKVSASVLQAMQEYKLAYTTLEQMKIQVEAQKSLLDATQIIGDRLAAYNENLNHLTQAVRTKIERFDKNTLKV